MMMLRKGDTPPDFRLSDTNGHWIRLSDYQEKQNVLLVFNRGFA
jgi:peroxiredoxin